MTSSVPTRVAGVTPALPTANNGRKPADDVTSGFPVTISGSGSTAPGMSQHSERLNSKAASVSPARSGKKLLQRARTTIAVSWEVITATLDKMDTSDELAALMELHRRATRRLETVCEKINELAAEK